jgi:hypothetical protein
MGSSSTGSRSTILALLAWAATGIVFAGEAPASLPDPAFLSASPAGITGSRIDAGRAERAEPLSPSVRMERVGAIFVSSPLLGRISRNMERSGAFAELRVLADRRLAGGGEAEAAASSQRLSQAGQGALKSALVDWAEDATDVDELIDPIASGSQGAEKDATHVRYDLGVSSCLPRLGMRLPTSVATRLTFGAAGRVGIDLAPGTAGRTFFHAGYDVRSGTVDVRALLRF